MVKLLCMFDEDSYTTSCYGIVDSFEEAIGSVALRLKESVGGSTIELNFDINDKWISVYEDVAEDSEFTYAQMFELEPNKYYVVTQRCYLDNEIRIGFSAKTKDECVKYLSSIKEEAIANNCEIDIDDETRLVIDYEDFWETSRVIYLTENEVNERV